MSCLLSPYHDANQSVAEKATCHRRCSLAAMRCTTSHRINNCNDRIIRFLGGMGYRVIHTQVGLQMWQ